MCSRALTEPGGARILKTRAKLRCSVRVIDHRREELSMNKDQVKGRIRTATGQVKVVTGNAVGNDRLAEKGKLEKVIGKVQAGYGDAKEKLKK
jgi:uncharacterized protein YjbJ (UPF0337 family)